MYLLVGQPSVLVTDNLKMSVCDFTISHSYSRWSVVWFFLPHGHVGIAAILQRYRYALIFPRPVTMVVNFGLADIFMFSLSATLGKESFLNLPLVVRFQSLCHLSTLMHSISRFTTLFGILL